MSRIKGLKDVVDWDLCSGCGACSYACSKGTVSLVNIESVGIRPKFDSDGCAGCTSCLSFCPGQQVDASPAAAISAAPSEGSEEFGTALEIWQGYASDPEIRFRASSGGVVTALSLYCLEHESMNFVLHSAMNQERPWENQTVTSRTRAELLSRTGSRYASSSPCEGLSAIVDSDGPCVFIGKPCDTAAVSKLRAQRPELDGKLGLVLTFFCAGTPSSQGTLELASSLDIRPEQINSVRYRGEGWPGRFKILYDGGTREKSLSYDESWGSLTHYRPLRCNLCPDGLGRLADIACGDAWDSFADGKNPGLSLVIVRTERGRQILKRAMAAGYVQLTPAAAGNVLAAQSSLLSRRSELFGRLVALRAFGIPIPRFSGFSLFAGWLKLPLTRKAKTILGTAKRVMRRRLYLRRHRTSDAALEGIQLRNATTLTDSRSRYHLEPDSRAALADEESAQPTSLLTQ
jgi:coenzyme F420 hydrogenase subunit beta